MKRNPLASNFWSVYIVRCANGALYTGITNRLGGRIADHNSGRGARYTAAFGPVELVWHKRSKTRSTASKLEARIKKMPRPEKEALALAAKKRKISAAEWDSLPQRRRERRVLQYGV